MPLIGMMMLMMSCSNPISPEPKDPNAVFWAAHPELITSTDASMKAEQARLINIDNVRSLMWRFTYVPEIEPFLPTVKTVFARNLCGDCQSAAVLGQWALECIGIEASLAVLKGSGMLPHMIALAGNHRIFVSNTQVVYLPETRWETSLLKAFTPNYQSIEVKP